MIPGSSSAQLFGAAGAAASGGDDGYVITRSLRFSSSDTAYLDRTVSIYSNQQQWTWSGWVKRAKLGTEQVIFTAGASTAGTRWSALRFQTDDSLGFINNGGGSTDINLVTSRLFRDPSAWYHIVVRANIQDEVSGNRISIYVNGQEETDFATETQPSASTSTGINYNQIHNIGREAARTTYYCDLLLAEVNFVDGLALTADNFGRTNSTTGSWEPIDFSSAPNNGTTWSDYLTTDDGSFDASFPKTNAFNGNQTNRAICNTAVGGTSYIQFNSPVPLSGTLRVRCDNNNEVYNVSGGSSTLLGQNTSGSDNSFVDCGEVTGLTSLKILMVSGSRAGVSTIEVGGVILIDDFNKFTNGTFYSNFASGVANLQRMFDNDSGTWANVAAGDTVTFEPGTAIACTQLELWVDTTTPIRVDVNGGGYGSTFTTSGLQYIDITPGGGISSLTSLLIDAPSGGGGSGAGVRGIRINGTTVLQDATIGRNSFSLKFNDSSSAAALGTDSANGNDWTVNNISAATGGPTSVDAATGALPIYNTTDTYGQVQGSGTRTDSNSSSLSIALPLYQNTNDVSNSINSGSTTKTITNTGQAMPSTNNFIFYGGSYYFDGTNDYLSASTLSAFDPGSGDFTVECWIRPTTIAGNGHIIASHGGTAFNDQPGWALFLATNGTVKFYAQDTASTSTYVNGVTALSTNKWYHVAATRSGNDFKIYINGSLDVTKTSTLSNISTSSYPLYVGRSNGNGGEYYSRYTGYIQDFRIYQDVKYSSSFIVPAPTQDTSVAADCDSLFDSPTNGTQTDTGVGGEVSGNYCTMSPLVNRTTHAATFNNGNLQVTFADPAVYQVSYGTVAVTSGKWYFEVTAGTFAGNTELAIGVSTPNPPQNTSDLSDRRRVYKENGDKRDDTAGTPYGATFSSNDVIGCAFDLVNGTITFYKNGASQGTAFTDLLTAMETEGWTPYVYGFNVTFNINFGQRAFAYTAPTGFQPLTTALFVDPTIVKSSSAMDATLYTGNGTSQVISGLEFSPDLVWIKQRSTTRDHCLCDIVRGPNLRLRSNSSYRETNESVVTAFNTNGFDIGSDAGVNQSSGTYVAWTWGGGSDYTDSTYNQSETWSTSLTAADGFYTPDGETADKAFDGRTTTYAANSITGTNNNTPLVFSKTITGITSMRIMFKGRLHLNGGSELASESSNGVWYTVSSPPSTLTQVDVYPYTQAAIGPRFYALEINGKILVDTGVNIEGSITSSVRVNASAGFSVVTATGSASSSSTVGHGLNAVPSFIAVKLRELAGNGFDQDWQVYHSSIGNTGGLKLNTVANTETSSVIWNNTSPTSTVFSIGASSRYDGDFVAYCWIPVEGYSAFGSYTGNASTDGPFVYTGFRPKWIVIKNSSASAGWYMFDEERDTYNLTTQLITANTDTQEYTDADVRIDILSNGFKLRSAGGQCNGSTNVMVYSAFASNPFKTARAR